MLEEDPKPEHIELNCKEVGKVNKGFETDNLSRRTLVKLIALAGPALLGSPLDASRDQGAPVGAADRQAVSGRPRLFYSAASLKRIERLLAADEAANTALRQRGDQLLKAEFFPESVAEVGGGQQANYVTPASQVADMGLMLGLLFHLTGDKTYAKKLRAPKSGPMFASRAGMKLLEGLIWRQARCILIDPYANAFMADLSAPPLQHSPEDLADKKQGVGERKWELDSLCYVIRLAHGYWKQTGNTAPFDSQWHKAMQLIVAMYLGLINT